MAGGIGKPAPIFLDQDGLCHQYRQVQAVPVRVIHVMLSKQKHCT
jgi:hypothetical protein